MLKVDELEPSMEYIRKICKLYDFVYDDRTKVDWVKVDGEKIYQGKKYRSLRDFQEEVRVQCGERLSINKLKKILISGGCYSTQATREVQQRLAELTASVEEGGQGMSRDQAIVRIATEMERDPDGIYLLIPYRTTVYSLKEKTKNAIRIERYRQRRTETENKMEEKCEML